MTHRLVLATGMAGLLTAGTVLAELLPAASWLPPVRRFCPALAGRGDPGHVALTFDDGPHPVATPLLLDQLADLQVHATFFLLAEQVMRYPDIACRIRAGGHELAVHGLRHDPPVRPWRDRMELAEAQRIIAAAAGRGPRWYRPPYGVLTASRHAAARRLGLRPVLWTTWGRDWRTDSDARAVRDRVLAGVSGGGTVLLHDSDVAADPGCWRATLGAVAGIVTGCRDRGWSVGPLGGHGCSVPPRARRGGWGTRWPEVIG